MAEPGRSRMYSDDVVHMIPAAAMGSHPTALEKGSTFYARTFAPLTAGGIRQSVFTLVQTALGGGVLTISYMLNLSGLGLGVILLVVAGLVALISMDILMKSAVILNTYNFSGLLSACLGPKSGIFLDVMLFLYGNGALVTYLIFLGDFMPNILLCLYGGAPSWCLDLDTLRTGCLFTAMMIVIPMSLPRDLSALRFVSPVALGGIVYTALVVAAKCPGLHAHSHGAIEIFKLNPNIFQSFSICIFAYNCHLNVVPVAKELSQPNDSRIGKTTFRVVLVQLVFYAIIAVGGYLSFLEATPQNLLSGYPAADPMILASRVMLSATILVTMATTTNPTVRSLLCLLEIPFPQIQEVGTEQLLDCEGAPAQPGQAKNSSCRDCLRYLGSAGCLMLDMTVAIFLRDVASVVGFLGASVGTLMMMVIPVLLLQVGCPSLYPPAKKFAITVLLSVAAIASLASLVML